MKICRFLPSEYVAQNPGQTPREAYEKSRGGILDDAVIHEVSGDLWGARERTGRQSRASDVRFVPPSWPSKIICIARNYVDHAAEMQIDVPKQPVIFSKPPSAIIAPEAAVVLPRISQRVDFEGELAFIVGRRCFHPRPSEDIRPYILGYTCLNDVTARDLQRLDGQYTRGKGFDTFCPFGPVVETEIPPPDTTVETYLNGVRKQFGHLSEMVFSVEVIFRWIAEAMTLEPGDVVATGTPAGVGPMVAGDVVEVRVGGIGTLRNSIVAARD